MTKTQVKFKPPFVYDGTVYPASWVKIRFYATLVEEERITFPEVVKTLFLK